MGVMLEAIVSWPTFVAALVVFGFAPGLALRLIVLAFPKGDPRRQELLAEVYVVPRLIRPFWVAEQLEVAVCEGLRDRVVWAATGRIIHRWFLESGVELNRAHPESFWIPNDEEKAAVVPGDLVKVLFSMKDGWGERMWVTVTAVKRRHLEGELNNQPIGIPRLWPGDRVKFRLEHVINIWDDEDAEYIESLAIES